MTSIQQPDRPERPTLSDRAVASLPLSSGRAELLEEIMNSPVLDHPAPPRADRPAARRWLIPAAAAVLVAGLVGVPAWLATDSGQGGEGAGRPSGVAGAPSTAPAGPAGHRAVLDLPGWEVDYVQEDEHGGELSYTRGERSLEIHWRLAETYDGYVEDRSEGGAQPGEPVELLGLPALLWAYSADDHTVIREPALGFLLEVRGSGMGEGAYLELLERLRLVDDAGFEAALPESYVSAAERDEEVQAILDDISETTYPLFPDGHTAAVTSTEPDRYHLGADVAGAVACAWLAEFRDAHAAGDERGMDNASDALIGSRDWPILHEMASQGGWPEVLWSYVDQVAAGEVPEGFEGGLGCG